MEHKRERTLHRGWWTLILVVSVVTFMIVTSGLFAGTFKSYVRVTLTSDRSGLVMEPNAKVKLRGVEVGRVSSVVGTQQPVSLQLDLDPAEVKFIPANVQAEIKATTAFGAKYVNLIVPGDASAKRLTAGAVIRSKNVSTEVNTVFQNLTDVLEQVDPAKLNSVLSAIAEGVRGKGQRIGEATTDANQVLMAINPRSETVRRDWQALKGFSDTYSAAAQNILTTLDAVTTTSSTITANSKALDSLLLNVIGLSDKGTALIGPNMDNLVRGINVLEPTSRLLMKYNPEITCLLVGAYKVITDYGFADELGGANGKSAILDAALLFGDDPYKYPDNLPINGAKGGPGGKPGCGSLPDVSKNWPVRALVTNTGFGTGEDIRTNPGIGFPGYMDLFPVTRGTPRPPSIRNQNGPAPGPIPYPGAPAFGAQQYAPDGTPLYPGLPPAPPPGAPREPGPPPPGTEPFVPPFPAQTTPTPLPSPSPPPPAPPPLVAPEPETPPVDAPAPALLPAEEPAP